jgi:hypothetical protein
MMDDNPLEGMFSQAETQMGTDAYQASVNESASRVACNEAIAAKIKASTGIRTVATLAILVMLVPVYLIFLVWFFKELLLR